MNPYDPSLSSETAVHETAAVLRLLQQGWTAPQICSKLRLSNQQLQHELNVAIDDELEASRTGSYIHTGGGNLEDPVTRDNYLRIYG